MTLLPFGCQGEHPAAVTGYLAKSQQMPGVLMSDL